MILLSLVLYFYVYHNPGTAFPISSSVDSNGTSHFLPRDADGTNTCPRQRAEIIWSCLSTILAASWVSVHPNLPHSEDSIVRRNLRRVELMLWAIIAPELIILWAIRQWHGARRMEKEFQESSRPTEAKAFVWTRTHGFFLQMGGFVLINGHERVILGWKPLMQYYEGGKIDLSDITKSSINDHSKADGFAKGLALLQTCWFIIQCLARFADPRLLLTELELITAALAVLSLVLYFLWWDKPFNAEIPIRITIISGTQIGTSNTNNDTQDQSGGHNDSKVKSQSNDFKNTLWIFEHIGRRVTQIVNEDFGATSNADLLDDQKRKDIPTFYSLSSHGGLSTYRMLWASFLIVALFGAIHCAGWSSKVLFSSHITSRLWRISSAIITGIPLVWILVAVFFCIEETSQSGGYLKKAYGVLVKMGSYLVSLTMPLYILSRSVLFVLAFLEIRSLPPGALATIQWAHFIPSIH